MANAMYVEKSVCRALRSLHTKFNGLFVTLHLKSVQARDADNRKLAYSRSITAFEVQEESKKGTKCQLKI